MTAPRITGVAFTPASTEHERSGLLGWVALTLDGAFLLDGIALRRARSGRHILSFPARTDSRGHRHPFVQPLDDDARQQIESAVFVALGIAPEESTS